VTYTCRRVTGGF